VARILTFFRKLPAEQQKQALSAGGLAYRDAPAAAREPLGKADEEYHRQVVRSLNADLESARPLLH
jgi:hypothetical protein